MPKHLVKRYLPDPEQIARLPGLGRLGPSLADPRLWYINRRSVARAMAWGLFCSLMPLPLQSFFAALGAIGLRCNLPLSVMLCWLSNPLTLMPLLVGAYWLGSTVFGVPMLEPRQVGQMFAQLARWIMQEGPNPFIHEGRGMMLQALLVGLIIEAVLAASCGWALVHFGWRWHIRRQWQRRCAARRAAAQLGDSKP